MLSLRGKGRESDARFRNLCRRLGFGLLGVAGDGTVRLLLSPAAPPPRPDKKLRSKLVQEHQRRVGDPSAGGSTRTPVMTAYRQQALTCAKRLAAGPQRPRDLRPEAPDAASILRGNVYGWFERPQRGWYGLTHAGRAALERWAVKPPPCPACPPAAAQKAPAPRAETPPS